MAIGTEQAVRAVSLAQLQSLGQVVVTLGGEGVVLFWSDDKPYAVDNRCPHMGFPLHRGSVNEGILTCHWHHARFDLASGGTFDLFADDVRAYPVSVRDGDVWVDLSPRGDPTGHQRDRLRDGLEHGLPLVIAKSVVFLLESGDDPAEAFRIGLDFGSRYRGNGWGQGLTMHTCFMNLLPSLDPDDRARAMYQGLSAVARDTAGQAPHFQIRPLPNTKTDPAALKEWFRRFVEVRDGEGAERCIVSAVRAGADHREMTNMLFAAATDHRFLQGGHVLDFTNKALEALDVAGWEYADQILSSLAWLYADATRAEESNSWRHPVDLVAILEEAFEALPSTIDRAGALKGNWEGRNALVTVLLGEKPSEIATAILVAIRDGVPPVDIAAIVSYAAALRIAQFHTSNEFADWDTALHTFSFANAVHQGLRRSPSPELVRGIFDAAISVYLDRFLNVPATRLPEPPVADQNPAELLETLPRLLDRQQQVNQVGGLVANYLFSGGDANDLIATLGHLLLREDRDFHTIQTFEAAVKLHGTLSGTREGIYALVAAARYLAAHFPTVRSQEQTFNIAQRLHRGDNLYEEDRT